MTNRGTTAGIEHSMTHTATEQRAPSRSDARPTGPAQRAEHSDAPPMLPLRHLETLWLQVTGTLCNLACLHCFISCGPKNDSHPFMSLEQIQDALDEAKRHGVREYYFTGGEPFMHPDILEIIDRTLAQGPVSILTNGVLIDAAMAARLRAIFDETRYSLDLRVSLDGTTAATNDPIRGRGTFERIIAGVRALADVGLNPVLTVTEVNGPDPAARDEFRTLLQNLGLSKPRFKFLSPFRIGREERRGRGYDVFERLRAVDMAPGDGDLLQCSSCRMVTAKGAYPCPILIEVDDARLGDRLSDALGPISLAHPACYTCHVDGVTCRT